MRKATEFFDGWTGRAANLYGLWPLAPAIFNSLVTGYLASATTYVVEWGRLGWWIGAFVVGATTYLLIVAGGLWAESKKLKRIQREIAERSISTSLINPLSKRFFQQRILLRDLADPIGAALDNRTFEECDLLGPATIVLLGDYIKNSHTNVEFAKIDDDKLSAIPNKLIFNCCTIRECKVANVLFLVPRSHTEKFNKGFAKDIPWLN